jgi:hypothetical protein
MNDEKHLEGSCHDLIEVLSWHLPGGTDENHRKSVMIADAPPEIQTKYFLNASLGHYLQTNLFGLLILAIWTVILLSFILRLVAMMESNPRPFEY